jgi:hypothetical protein
VFVGRRKRGSCICLLDLGENLAASHHPPYPMIMQLSGSCTTPLPHLQDA